MSGWTKLAPIDPIRHCDVCGPKPQILPLDAYVHPGFGGAQVYAADEESLGQSMYENATLRDVEEFAWAHGGDEHDWRLSIDGPLYAATYQRQGEGLWVLVERGEGFA